MAGTVVVTRGPLERPRGGVDAIRLLCTADAADGSFPDTVLPPFSGTLLALATNPANTPTANYDITLIDQDGLDRLNGVGANRHTTTSERVAVTGLPFVYQGEPLTLNIDNNTQNSAVVEITLYFDPTGNSAGSILGSGTSNIGDVDVATTVPPLATTATLSNVNDAASSTDLLVANTSRKGVILHNDSDQILYLKYGSTDATTTSYTYEIAPQAHWEMPFPIYTGQLEGIWAADSSGAARITELT